MGFAVIEQNADSPIESGLRGSGLPIVLPLGARLFVGRPGVGGIGVYVLIYWLSGYRALCGAQPDGCRQRLDAVAGGIGQTELCRHSGPRLEHAEVLADVVSSVINWLVVRGPSVNDPVCDRTDGRISCIVLRRGGQGEVA